MISKKAIDTTLILGSMALWVFYLKAAGSLVYISAFPERSIVGFSVRFVVLVALLLIMLVAHLWHYGLRPAPPEKGVLKVFGSRVGWLSGILLASLAVFFASPYASAILVIFGAPIIITWALLKSLPLPAVVVSVSGRHVFYTCLLLLVVATGFYTIIGVYFTKVAGEHSGDEGHYLIQARSLYEDRDLNIRNQFDDPDNTPVHGSPHSRGDAWYPRHAAGLPLLLWPTVPFGLFARHFVLALISGITLVSVFLLSLKMGAHFRYACCVTVLFGLSLFWGIYSSRALPEVLGAGLTTWGLLMCLWQERRPWTATFICLCLIGFLPWAHTRFIPIAGLLFGCFGLHGLLYLRPFKPLLIRMTVFSLLFILLLAFYQYVQWQMYEGGQAYAADSLLFSMPMGLWHTLASDRGILYVFPLFACSIAALL